MSRYRVKVRDGWYVVQQRFLLLFWCDIGFINWNTNEEKCAFATMDEAEKMKAQKEGWKP